MDSELLGEKMERGVCGTRLLDAGGHIVHSIDKHVRYIVWLMREFDQDVSHPSGCADELGECKAVYEYVRIVFIINLQIDCSVAYYFACNIQVMR